MFGGVAGEVNRTSFDFLRPGLPCFRYEFSREFAPYISYSRVRAFGMTADMAGTARRPISDRQILLGKWTWL